MNKYRKRISIYKIAKTFTPEELKRNQRIGNLRMYLGIYSEVDSSINMRDNIERTPSMYKSIQEYNAEKQYAEDCIYNGIEIPHSIVQRLVAARKELEQQGILEPIE